MVQATPGAYKEHPRRLRDEEIDCCALCKQQQMEDQVPEKAAVLTHTNHSDMVHCADLSEEQWQSVNVLLNCGSPVKRNLEEVWPHLSNLEWLHSTAAGVEHILFPGLVEGPVTLTNAKASNLYASTCPATLCELCCF